MCFIKNSNMQLFRDQTGQAMAEAAVMIMIVGVLLEGLLFFGNISDDLFRAEIEARNEAWEGHFPWPDLDQGEWANSLKSSENGSTMDHSMETNYSTNNNQASVMTIEAQDWKDILFMPFNFVNGTSRGDVNTNINERLLGQRVQIKATLYVDRHTWSMNDAISTLMDAIKGKSKEDAGVGNDGDLDDTMSGL